MGAVSTDDEQINRKRVLTFIIRKGTICKGYVANLTLCRTNGQKLGQVWVEEGSLRTMEGAGQRKCRIGRKEHEEDGEKAG